MKLAVYTDLYADHWNTPALNELHSSEFSTVACGSERERVCVESRITVSFCTNM
ncbi:MAG: hypothetical protein SO015_06600 [Wujia sp.]|nr:hypothetical protein [Wujia sp.]MBU5475476.1 hypothetical protein [Eubacterium sp. MSJ-21]MDY3727804.1 hypothetical protein [Wujia sp.]